METFVIVSRKDPKVRIKMNDTLDRHMRLLYKYQSKIGYDTLIQNIILTEIIKTMSLTITDLDIEIKMKNSRNRYLESKNSYNCKYSPV